MKSDNMRPNTTVTSSKRTLVISRLARTHSVRQTLLALTIRDTEFLNNQNLKVWDPCGRLVENDVRPKVVVGWLVGWVACGRVGLCVSEEGRGHNQGFH